MRIILFHQYFLGKNDSGGSRWNQLTRYFTSDGNTTIDVIAGNIHYTTGKQIGEKIWHNKEKISEQIILYRTWTFSGYNVNFFGRLMGYFSYTFSSLLKALFLKKPDIIIVTSPPIFVGISAWILSKVKRVPFVFEVRDLWPESAIATGVLKSKYLITVLYRLEKLLYKDAQKIIVLTPAFELNINSRFPEFSHKIEIITNGADFDSVSNQKNIKNIKNKYGWLGKKVFAYFGAHGIANDLMQIIEVANIYKNDNTLLFVLVGDGMQKEMLQKKAKFYHLTNVQFIDPVPKHQVNDYIEAADICMATLKKSETFKTVYPNKVFDYLRCKKPVLVTIDGITRKLIESSKSGLYAEAGSSISLSKAVLVLKDLPSHLLYQMGENGFNYVEKYFNREVLAAKYLAIIKKEVE